ncbi:prepilin-type N-terminal cleavage/methylation domain-containing protein [Leptolyngbya sp. BL0902]|uniref:type IV pilus modification PilV family protein n=1 Tax=Leptolyngbya sp. BL0902 TaxID=1115757 RepID=UPI0018E9015F|nr:type II secretion system protein [Leptolyngbya sp. BL0902]QQE64248.1 prepilin-type N-terminal cleavage/methylation domain-containing protein [Leptolyngbya sp. BL0902]
MKPTRFLPPSVLRDRGSRLARGLPLANHAGLTLIECLVAIVMVALVASAITPALVLSVATRVQSQKAEQAMALGQSEIDRIRTLAERGQLVPPTPLPALTADSAFRGVTEVPVAANNVLDNDPAAQVGAAVGLNNIVNRNGPALPATTNPTQTRQFDVNNDGTPDFVVQTYRTRGLVVNGEPVAFAVGVRVYDYNAVANGTGGNLEREPISLGISAGQGQRLRRPITAFYTTVSVSERGDSLCDLLRYSQSTTGVNVTRPPGCPP